jgi:hypothetical protein
MNNRFLISVAAAALIVGTGFANAQGTGTSREAPSAGSTVQQSAPPSERGGASSATTNRDAAEPMAPSSGMKATQSEPKSPAAGTKQRADDSMQGQKSKSMSSENEAAKGREDMKTEGREDHGSNVNAETKGATDSKSQTTTGNAATSATAAPPAEKRTQIVSAIKSEKVEEVTSVNFNVSVGATVPASVRLHPLPPRIVEIYPDWRGYEFILVHGRYVIIRPQTHEIVYIIEG